MNTLQKFEARQLEKLKAAKNIPAFNPGDTIKVNVKVREGSRERIQAFEGVCIARKGSGLNETFTVRKISYGEGVERVFPLWSSRVDSIELMRTGSVRRAKLYYLRARRGKSARIAERARGQGEAEAKENTNAPQNDSAAKSKKAPAKAKKDKKKSAAEEKQPEKKAKKSTQKENKSSEN